MLRVKNKRRKADISQEGIYQTTTTNPEWNLRAETTSTPHAPLVPHWSTPSTFLASIALLLLYIFPPPPSTLLGLLIHQPLFLSPRLFSSCSFLFCRAPRCFSRPLLLSHSSPPRRRIPLPPSCAGLTLPFLRLLFLLDLRGDWRGAHLSWPPPPLLTKPSRESCSSPSRRSRKSSPSCRRHLACPSPVRSTTMIARLPLTNRSSRFLFFFLLIFVLFSLKLHLILLGSIFFFLFLNVKWNPKKS